MKNKNILLILLLLVLSISTRASESFECNAQNVTEGVTEGRPTHFILWLNDGSKVAFLLAHTPQVVNGDGFITVVDADLTIEYPLSNVDRFTMGVEDVPTSADGLDADVTGSFNVLRDAVVLSGFKPGDRVVAASIDGRCVYDACTDNSGSCTIDISAYTPGVYVFKINTKSFKITKR